MVLQSVKEKIPGILLVTFLVLVGSYLSLYINKFFPLETITLVIILGIIYNNTIGSREIHLPGINFVMNKVIKLAIILLGFKLNFTILYGIGLKAFILVLLYVPLVIFLGLKLGKYFNLDNKTSLLVGIGSGICGVAAIMSLSPLVKAKKDEIIVAASVTSFLGAMAVILFSFFGSWQSFPMEAKAFGVWCGISLHGVSHAIAAAYAMGAEAGEIGTVVKLARVLMLVPMSILFTHYFRDEETQVKPSDKYKMRFAWIQSFPLYVIMFILVMIINSLGIVPVKVAEFFASLSNIGFLFTMTSLGLSLYLKSVLVTGIKGLKLGLLLFAFVSISSYFLINIIY